MTVTAAAEGLGVTRKALSDLLNGHGGVSPEMAIRLEKAGVEHRRCVANIVFHCNPTTISVRTLEGVMVGDAGDWIICGVNGELYPCKPSIFENPA
jgi:Helix-turn-helix